MVQDQSKQMIERFDRISRSYVEQLRNEREDREVMSKPIPSQIEEEAPSETSQETKTEISLEAKPVVSATQKPSRPEVSMEVIAGVLVWLIVTAAAGATVFKRRRPLHVLKSDDAQFCLPLDNGLSEGRETKLQNK